MSATVTVACKLPHGLVLQLFDMAEHQEPIMAGGYKKVQKAVKKGDPVTIHGVAARFGEPPKVMVVGGYALNSGVDKDFWEAWLKANKDHDAVKGNLIFAMEKNDDAIGRAKDQEEVRSNLEPLVPDTDPRIPRRPDGRRSVETANKAA